MKGLLTQVGVAESKALGGLKADKSLKGSEGGASKQGRDTKGYGNSDGFLGLHIPILSPKSAHECPEGRGCDLPVIPLECPWNKLSTWNISAALEIF